MIPIYFLEENDKKINSDFPFNLHTRKITSNIPPHGHNFLELHYVSSGHGIEIINGVKYEMKPGTFAVILPHQIHEINIDAGNEVFLFNFGISLKVFFESGESNLALSKLLFGIDHDPVSLYILDKVTSQKIFNILNEMYIEFNGEQVWNRLMFRAKLVELMVLFDRYRRSCSNQHESVPATNQKNDIWTIVHYVYKNYRENITLKDLSNRFFLSVPYISSSFKQCLGVNFRLFLRNVRIENACSLLLSKEVPISDIAYEVGFNSYSTFVRVFHECKGVSPSSYRELKSISLDNQCQPNLSIE